MRCGFGAGMMIPPPGGGLTDVFLLPTTAAPSINPRGRFAAFLSPPRSSASDTPPVLIRPVSLNPVRFLRRGDNIDVTLRAFPRCVWRLLTGANRSRSVLLLLLPLPATL